MDSFGRIISIAISLSLSLFILNLVRKRKLKEKYALLWLLTGFCILILTISQNLMNWITYILGITMPINMLFFLGIFFILLINIHFSMVISDMTEQIRKLAQKLSLLEFESKKHPSS